jgi:hypothetical protein
VAADLAHILDQLLQRDARAGHLEDLAGGIGAGQRLGHHLGHVAHVHRLEAGAGAAQGHQREGFEQAGEEVEEAVARPEDHRGAQDGPCHVRRGGADRRLAGGLGALVFGRAIGVGAEGAHMHDAPHPGLAGGGHQAGRQLDVGAGEGRAIGLARGRMEHPDEAHHRIHAGHQAPEGGRVEHVGLDDLGGGQRQQVAGTVAAAGGKHQRDAGGGQRLATALPTKPLPPTIRTLRGYMMGLRET